MENGRWLCVANAHAKATTSHFNLLVFVVAYFDAMSRFICLFIFTEPLQSFRLFATNFSRLFSHFQFYIFIFPIYIQYFGAQREHITIQHKRYYMGFLVI